MASELVKKFDDMRAFLTSDRMKAQVALALPKHLDADRVIRIMMTSIQRTPKLLDCTKESMVAALLTCSQLGLEPDGASGMAYLIPYGRTATLIVGYKGLIQLAYRSEQVGDIAAVNVYDNESFSWRPCANPPIDHVPLPPSRRGGYKGSYAVISIKGADRPHVEWMWAEEINAIRERSKAGNSGPWVTDTDEMRRKTVVRRALKYIPSSPELRTAIQQVDEQEFAPIDAESIQTNGATRTENLKRRLVDSPTPESEFPEMPPVENTNEPVPIMADEHGHTVAVAPAVSVQVPAEQPTTPNVDDLVNDALLANVKKAAAGVEPDERAKILKKYGLENLIGKDAKKLTRTDALSLKDELESAKRRPSAAPF